MNDEPLAPSPDNANDRVILDYLQQMLCDKAAAAAAETARASSDNIAPFDVNRSRRQEPPARIKTELRQPVALPFRVPEKNRVLTVPSLLPLPPPVSPAALSPSEVTPPERVAPEIAPAEVAPPEPVDAGVLPPALPDEALDARLPSVPEWQDNGRPAWAQQRFECLIFTVSGLKLAVPLATLGAIHRVDRKFNVLPHQSPWFLGILQTPAAGNIKVLDTALCVMPERHDPAERATLAYVITLHGFHWGLACHQVERSITLEPDQIKWRTQRGKRPWLAGTVVEHMCALIDTEGFREVIRKAESIP